MRHVFFIVGPTATGKSDIAAEIAQRLNAEIISADAFQIYRGLDLLTAKPGKTTLTKAPHHLLGTVPLTEEMNVERFWVSALEALRDIQARGKQAIVAGGSGLYVKALTHGLSNLPGADPKLRARLSELSLDELRGQLVDLDPVTAGKIDLKNRRRVTRALEICLLSEKPFSAQRTSWDTMRTAPDADADDAGSTGILPVGQTGILPVSSSGQDAHWPHRQDACATPAAMASAQLSGVFVFRDRAELYERINRRVENMFADNIVDEVRRIGAMSSTASQTLGLREIRALIAGEISETACIARIQQRTRHYAKRQLTWFQRQSNFEPLNLSSHGYPEAIELIAQNARRVFCAKG
jgi:tRNA dimethylallyltransferase